MNKWGYSCIYLYLLGMLYLQHNDTNNELALFATALSVQVDITTRCVYVICFLFFSMLFKLALMASEISADFFSRLSSRGLEQDIHWLTQATTLTYSTIQPNHKPTRHMLLVQWFSRRNVTTKKINHILHTAKMLVNLFSTVVCNLCCLTWVECKQERV